MDMQQQLLIAFCAGLGGMLGWGFADFFAKKTVDKIGDIASLVWAHVFGTILLGFIVLYQIIILKQSITIPIDVSTWLWLIFFGTLQSLVYLLVYKGFGKGKLAILNPIFASFTGLVAIFSIGIFGESVSSHLLIALVVIFIGILAISIDPKALHTKKLKLNRIPGLKEIAIATVLAAVWTMSWDRFIGGKDWLAYALYMYLFMTISAFIFSKFQRVKLSVVTPDLWKFLILIGVCEVVAYLAISLGYSATSLTSIVALLSGAFSLPTLVLAHIFLKEKVKRMQTIGALIIVGGIILLSLQ